MGDPEGLERGTWVLGLPDLAIMEGPAETEAEPDGEDAVRDLHAGQGRAARSLCHGAWVPQCRQEGVRNEQTRFAPRWKQEADCAV